MIYKLDADKIIFAVSYLTEGAATHYNDLLQQQAEGAVLLSLSNWDSFVKEFSLHFGLYDSARDAQTNLEYMRQMDNELFGNFIIRFQQYAFKPDSMT